MSRRGGSRRFGGRKGSAAGKTRPAGLGDAKSLSGTVERVTYHNEQTGFAVLQVRAKGQGGLVPVVGTLPSVAVGEWLEATGKWVVDREYGQQFKAERLVTAEPHTERGIERYLGSGLIKGVGPALAKRLVRAFGTEVLDTIENQPDRLTEVEGIGAVRRQRILSAWQAQRVIRQIMLFLHSHGVGTNRAFRIYKTYGDAAIAIVRENPYRLAHDIRGIGFKSADQIASSLGIDPRSDIRARAGVEYVLACLTDDGHCGYPRRGLVDKTAEMLEIPGAIIEQALAHGIGEDRLVSRQLRDRELIYLAALDASEEGLARNLLRLARGAHPCPKLSVDKAVRWVQDKLRLQLAEAQGGALRTAVASKVLVITGGPGVGKTTLVNAIVKVLGAKGLRVVLCAPTGRAAKRLYEASGQEAKTIHRLLEFDPHRGSFRHDAERPLAADVLIVDETSMIDVVLAHHLVKAIPPQGALLLVGDVDQLPSVGPGSVLGDIIASGAVPVCRLQEVFRQAARSQIVTNAHRVNAGEMPHYPTQKVADPRQSDFYLVEAREPEEAEAKLLRLVSRDIPRRFGFDPIADIQVLTPMQRGVLGARNLNQNLQQLLNPRGEATQRFGITYRVGDKVMQTHNDYDKDVFNGDIGLVRGLNPTEREAVIEFEGRQVVYAYDELDEVALSYAITVHKSQGSEYPCVVIPVHTQHYIMLQRNLLYTAITRGRQLVVLVGSRQAVAMAAKRTGSHDRITTLRERLRGWPSGARGPIPVGENRCQT